jgi:hypothetical protein
MLFEEENKENTHNKESFSTCLTFKKALNTNDQSPNIYRNFLDQDNNFENLEDQDKDIKQGAWEKEEHKMFIKALIKHGKNWQKVNN